MTLLQLFDQFRALGHDARSAERNACAEYARMQRMTPDKARTLLRDQQRGRKHAPLTLGVI